MLSCTLDGTTPITYQWYKKDVLVNDAKESVLILETLQRDAAGDYKCSATNSAGTKFSAKKSITVNCKHFLYFNINLMPEIFFSCEVC